ncbi:MAG: T9SS type A sorting domain-containing protein [Flavobacteriaceae bacterium]|nr:T9SS type A sorting domain-containing protein [Flavobacteriaceae bacterium]
MKNKITFILLLLTPILVFSQWNQIGQDLDGEGAFDRFGRAVSLSDNGNIVAIGAYENDGNGVNSGHVRVFENIGNVWTQIGSDIDGESSGDNSGFAVSLSGDGNIVAIGARNNTVNGPDTGHVRIYENTGGIWTQIGQDIDGEAALDLSGQALEISNTGNIVAIGANGNDGVNGPSSGHVRVYENLGGVWTQIGQDIDGEATSDNSGISVSINANGNIVAIGATLNANSGHVRVYENIGGTWTQIGSDIDGESNGDNSGAAVSLNNNGNILAIGANSNDGANGGNSGHVRVYENTGGTWTQIGQDIDGEAGSDNFGQAVELSATGDIVAVGAFFNDGNGADSGHVRVYERVGNSWIQVGDDIDGESAGDNAGIEIGLSADGSIVGVGAWRNSDNGIDSGSVKIYGNASLSIENNAFGEDISIYPNPTFGTSNINLGNIHDQVELFFYDALGKLVNQENYHNIDKLSIDTQNYSSGIYLLKIISGNQYVDLKLIKG